jgi:FkbM family methyltransferase
VQPFPPLAINKNLSYFSIQEILSLCFKPAYWSTFIKLKQLAHQARYQDADVEIQGVSLKVIDTTSFLAMYDEIFSSRIYKFKSDAPNPIILDAGANIGLSVLYFKQLYPNCQITAFEPDSKVFAVLQQNIRSAKLSDVTLINKAVWSSETVLQFMSEGADGGRMVQLEPETPLLINVETVRLRDYLDQPIDFLKIDIEGAETEVLQDCRDLLHHVNCLFVEYHSFSNESQSLAQITSILHSAGFRLYISPAISLPQPLYQRFTNLGMDVQLNIFAFRNP